VASIISNDITEGVLLGEIAQRTDLIAETFADRTLELPPYHCDVT
jgi:hypothetical protein